MVCLLFPSTLQDLQLTPPLVFARAPPANLTDYEVRDINDEINKLLREKHHWENQIIALGGANYKRAAGKMTDSQGKEVPGARGYK